MRTTWVLALAGLSFAGCRTKFEAVTCASDADCTADEYSCDVAQHRCVRRTCEQTADCAQEYGYTCEVETGRCVIATDGGPDGSTSCDRDADGSDGPQCDGDDCDDDDPARTPGHVELCNDGVDDDCDPTTSEGVDADDDDFCAAGGPSACCAEVEADCCDSDADAKPGVTAWFTMDDGETACGGWDYDCSTVEELQYPSDETCMCVSSCSGADGWSTAVIPPCGGSGDYVTCGMLACGSCPAATTMGYAQGCH